MHALYLHRTCAPSHILGHLLVTILEQPPVTCLWDTEGMTLGLWTPAPPLLVLGVGCGCARLWVEAPTSGTLPPFSVLTQLWGLMRLVWAAGSRMRVQPLCPLSTWVPGVRLGLQACPASAVLPCFYLGIPNPWSLE